MVDINASNNWNVPARKIDCHLIKLIWAKCNIFSS